MTSVLDAERSIRAAIAGFKDVLITHPRDQFERMRLLARALDNLVQAYHLTPDTEPDEGNDAPRTEYETHSKPASLAFPSLGYYPDVDPIGEITEEVLVGDAIDDLAYIARDLADVIWYFDQKRAETAIWEFRFGYQSHWGGHLHDLRLYLHRRLN